MQEVLPGGNAQVLQHSGVLTRDAEDQGEVLALGGCLVDLVATRARTHGAAADAGPDSPASRPADLLDELPDLLEAVWLDRDLHQLGMTTAAQDEPADWPHIGPCAVGLQ